MSELTNAERLVLREIGNSTQRGPGRSWRSVYRLARLGLVGYTKSTGYFLTDRGREALRAQKGLTFLATLLTDDDRFFHRVHRYDYSIRYV